MFSFQCCTYSVFKHKKRLVHVLQIHVIKETPWWSLDTSDGYDDVKMNGRPIVPI